jgi:hypothetical protein
MLRLNGEAGDSTAAPSGALVDSDEAEEPPLGQRCALPTLTTADGAAELFREFTRERKQQDSDGHDGEL